MLSDTAATQVGLRRQFEVSRAALSQVRVHESDPSTPSTGEVLFAVEHFGLSANNLTYALLGDRAGYWSLFPASDGWGQIPVWGYLRVLESRVGGIEAGQRAFGLSPMSTHVVMRPDRMSAVGFTDASGHRVQLPAVYNAYSWLDRDPAHAVELEELVLVLRPLFWLSFMLADLLAEEGLPAGRTVLLTSASSKAAIGAAYLLARSGAELVGLTSSANLDFVTGLGLYNQVVAYDAVAELPSAPAVLLDIAGSRAVRAEVASSFGNQLARVVVAGFTHLDAASADPEPDGGHTSLLSVPQRIPRRAKDLGWGELNRRYTDALHEFATHAERWLKITRGRGSAEVEAAYLDTLNNAVPADNAFVLTLADQRSPSSETGRNA